MYIGSATVENSMEVSQKAKNRTSIWPSNSTPEYIYLEKTETLIQKNTCIPMFIEELFTVVKVWKQPNCPSTDKWIKKMQYILLFYTHNGLLFSHKKRMKCYPLQKSCINLEGIKLSEVSQRKTNTVWYHLYVEPKKYSKLCI